jgi:hypothetical protein
MYGMNMKVHTVFIHEHMYAPTNKQLYLLIPRCRVLLKKLTGLQLVKKFPALHRTRRFITALTSVRNLSLSRASPIQSIYPHPTSWRCPNIIHPSTPMSHQWSLSLGFPHQDPTHPPLVTHMRHMPKPISFCLILSSARYWVRSTDHLAPRYEISCSNVTIINSSL